MENKNKNEGFSSKDIKMMALEKTKQKAVILDIEDMAEAEARKKADAEMTESKEKAGFFKKLWKHTFFDEYYRQKEINKAREKIKKEDNIYAGRVDNDKYVHQNAMHSVFERFASDYEGTLSEGEEKKIFKESYPEAVDVKNDIKNLIFEYAEGKINEDVFKSEKNKILDSLKKQNILNYSNNYADNLFEIAQNAKISIEHGAKLEELDIDTEIITGKAKSSLKTEAHFNVLDKAIDKIKKTKIGSLVSPAVLSTALALAYSTTIGVGSRMLRSKAAAYGTLGASVAVASVFSGLNESQRVTSERKQHALEMAEGGSFTKEDERRGTMDQYRFEMKNASDLASELHSLVFDKDENGNDIVKNIKSEDINKILESLSDIEARNSLNNKKKIDLISYSNIGKVEKERTDLTILTAKVKVELRKKLEGKMKSFLPKGMNFDSYLEQKVQVAENCLLGGESGIDAKDKAFKKFKAKRIAAKMATTALSGLLVGAAVQEGMAFFKDDTQGFIEGIFSKSEGQNLKSETPLEYLRSWITGQPNHMGMQNAVETNLNGHTFKLPEGTNIIQNSDGTYDILKGEEVISDNIILKFDANGNLDTDSINRLGEAGIVTNTTHTIIDSTKEIKTNAEEYVKNHHGNTTRVSRDGWYDNDTPKPVFDKNELKLHWGGIKGGKGIDINGNYVFNVKQMASDGSFHKEFSVDAQEKIKSGGLKMILSLTRETQHQVFEIPIDANGNAIVDPNSEIGKLFFETENGQAIFKGRFAEVVETFNSEDDRLHVKTLATLVGRGNDVINDVINTHTDIAVTNFEVPLETDPPLFIPIVPRTPLEPITYKKFNENGPNYYGYGEGGDFGLLKQEMYDKRFATALKENSECDFSGNDAKIIKEYFSKQDEKYLAEINSMAGATVEMEKNIKISITVPAYQEGKNIEKTIRNYAKLKNRENFELVIFENHPKSKERDNTGEIIEKMKKEFPDLNLVHLYKVFDKKPKIGEVRKYLVDTVLLRKQNAGIENSIAIASNDADLEDINENYANEIIKAFEKNKKLDAVGGKWDYPKKDFDKLPILHISQRLWHFFDIVFRNHYLKSPELIGRNSAFRSGTYAAIGGYNEKAKLAEDLEIGWMIKKARKYDSSRIAYLNKAWLTSNSRRAVTKMLSGGRLIEQYGDFHENEEVRNKSLEELLKDKKDFDEETFKKEVQAIYNYYAKMKKSRNGWVDDEYIDNTFKRAMGFLGVSYEKTGDQIKVKDISKMINGLEKGRKERDSEKEIENIREQENLFDDEKAKQVLEVTKDWVKYGNTFYEHLTGKNIKLEKGVDYELDSKGGINMKSYYEARDKKISAWLQDPGNKQWLEDGLKFKKDHKTDLVYDTEKVRVKQTDGSFKNKEKRTAPYFCQEGWVYYDSNYFDKKTGEMKQPERESTKYRVYFSCDGKDVLPTFQDIIQLLNDDEEIKKTGFQIKTTDVMDTDPIRISQIMHQKDSTVLYLGKKSFKRALSILKKYAEKNREKFKKDGVLFAQPLIDSKNNKIPGIKITSETIGFSPDPDEIGKKYESFSLMQGKIMEACFRSIVKSLKNPETLENAALKYPTLKNSLSKLNNKSSVRDYIKAILDDPKGEQLLVENLKVAYPIWSKAFGMTEKNIAFKK